MRKGRQISCRFELEPQACDGLITILARSGAEPTQKTICLAAYFDTQDAAIGDHGLALGIRHEGEVSRKTSNAAVDAFARGLPPPEDWMRFTEPLSAATQARARRWLRSALRRDLRVSAIFETETQGNHWSLKTDQIRAGIGLDRIRIAADEKEALFLTVAAAHKAGSAADFFRFMAQISGAAGLRMSAEGAALRGYRLCGKLAVWHVPAFAPRLAADMDASQAFRTIARACFDQFLLNESAVRLSRDREAVHQCRVALRRLSAALRLFASLVSGPGRDALRAELKRLAGYFQKARDLDVLTAEVVEPAIDSRAPASRDLLEFMEGRRKSAYDELLAALSAQRTANLFLDLVGWIEAGDWTLNSERQARQREPIAAFIERRLAKAARKFRERCEELQDAPPDERHKTRIRAKNLRYSAEFLEILVASKSAKGPKTGRKRFHAFVGALKDLQTILGKENDARMARRFAFSLKREIGESHTPKADNPLLAALETAAGECLPEAEFRKRIGKACRAFAAVKPFWSDMAA